MSPTQNEYGLCPSTVQSMVFLTPPPFHVPNPGGLVDLQVLKFRLVGSQRPFLENGAARSLTNWPFSTLPICLSTRFQIVKLLWKLEPSTWTWEVVPAVKGAQFLQSTGDSWLTTSCNSSFRDLLVLTTLMCRVACGKIHKLKKQAINKGTELGGNVQMSIFVYFWARYLACSISPSL